MEQNQNDQQADVATSGARPIDPDTGHPVEPELHSVSVVPEEDPSPEPTAEEWREAGDGSAPE